MREVVKRRWGRALDAAIGATVAALLIYESRRNPQPWELIGGLLAISVSVVAARPNPLISLTAASAASVAILFNFQGRVPSWPVLLLVPFAYFAGRRMERARPGLIAFVAIAIAGIPISLIVGRYQMGDWGAMTGVLLFAGFFPWQLARYVRLRDDLVRTGWQRAEDLEIQQRIIADEARLRERARIASDMHDSLGHELSLIAVRAGALEVAGGLDERQRMAAGELRESAAAATERLREIIGLLREDVAPTEPVDAHIDELVDRARASGLAMESDVDTDGAGPPMVERAAYRVVQESLTNVTKHAPGAAVSIRVSRSSGETVVRVRNARPPAGPLPGMASGHRGLAGLRERVRLLGGTLLAGPRDGGFEVMAWLPHDGSPAPDSPVTDAERSESARQLQRARRQVRRSLLSAFIVPPAIMVVLFGVVGLLSVYNWYTSNMDSRDYAKLQIGQPRAEITGLLPREQRDDRPEQPEPPGTNCEYYGTGRGIFELHTDVYRLCFTDGRLTSKDLLIDAKGDNGDPDTAGR